MIIVICPRCSAPYAVAEELIGRSGRSVRCSNCGNQWEYRPEAIADPFPVEPVVAEQPRPPAAVPPPPAVMPLAPPTPSPAASPESQGPDATPTNEETIVSGPGLDGSIPTSDADVSHVDTPSSSDHAGEEDGFEFADDEAQPAAIEDETHAASEPEPEIEPEREPDLEEHQEPLAPAPVTTASEEQKFAPAASRRQHLIVGALAAGVTLIVFVGGALVFKESIIATVPATKNVYALFGSSPPIPGEGLAIVEQVKTERRVDGVHEVIVISGSVTNTTEYSRPVPPLKVALVDSEKSPIETVIVPPSEATVAGNQAVTFEATMRDPGNRARNVIIVFAKDAEIGDSTVDPER